MYFSAILHPKHTNTDYEESFNGDVTGITLLLLSPAKFKNHP